jgi:MFS family permease
MADRRWLNRNVLGMGLTSLFSDMGHEMATAVLPFFLVFDLGGTAALVGLIEGASDGVSSMVKSYSGYHSDKTGRRKPTMYLGYVLTGTLIPAIGFCTTWFQVLTLRVFAWIGRGARGPPRDALLSESVPYEYVGRAFGFQRAMDTAGAVAGPAIALLLIPYLHYSSVIFVSVLPGMASVFVVASLVKEIGDRKTEKKSFLSSVNDLPKRFKLFLISVGLFGIANFSNVIFTLRAGQILRPTLGVEAASEFAIALYVLLNLVYAIASYPVGHLADRVSKSSLLAGGYLFFALACLASVFESSNLSILVIIFILAGLHVAIVDTVEGAYAAELLVGAQKGAGFGLLQTINGIGDLVSSILIGAMITYFSPTLGFSATAILSVVAASLLVMITRKYMKS